MEPTKPQTGPNSNAMHPVGALLIGGFVFFMVLLGFSYLADSDGVEGFLTGAGAIAIAVAVSKYFFGSSKSLRETKRTPSTPSIKSPQSTIISPPNEDQNLHAYALLQKELNSGIRDEVLWLKCISECEGNEAKAQASYNRARARFLEMEERLLKAQCEPDQARRLDLEAREKATISQFMSEIKIVVASVRQSQPGFNTWCKDQLTKLAGEIKDLLARGEGLVETNQMESLRWADMEISKALKSHEHDQTLLEKSKVMLEAKDVSRARSTMKEMRGRFRDLDYRRLDSIIEDAEWRHAQRVFGFIVVMVVVAGAFALLRGQKTQDDTVVSRELSQDVTPQEPLSQEPPVRMASRDGEKMTVAPEGKEEASALFKSGLSYYRGDGVQQNFVKAFELFELAANEGFGDAQLALGNLYAEGVGITKSAEIAMQWYLKAAEQGVADAQNNVGAMTARGEGCIANEPEAVKWYRKAAELNHSNAQFNLGMCYAYGRGVAQNCMEAARWWGKAAEQGLVDAQYNLGVLFNTGDGVPKSYIEAAKWWVRAANQNHPRAQNNLGLLYYDGEHFPKNHLEAEQWWLKAAAQGDADAQFNLGTLYEDEDSPKMDLKKAFEWYLKAAEKGLSEAQAALVEYYRDGLGIPQDKVEAYKWALLASSAEPEEYTEKAKALDDELNAPQKQEAASRAHKFRLLHESK